jgi:hypothetical protein
LELTAGIATRFKTSSILAKQLAKSGIEMIDELRVGVQTIDRTRDEASKVNS